MKVFVLAANGRNRAAERPVPLWRKAIPSRPCRVLISVAYRADLLQNDLNRLNRKKRITFENCRHNR